MGLGLFYKKQNKWIKREDQQSSSQGKIISISDF